MKKDKFNTVGCIVVALMTMLFCTSQATAQFNETIRSGRPGQSIGPYGVGKNIFQVQFGGIYSVLNNPQMSTEGKSTTAGFNLRFGLSEIFEINSAWSFQQMEETTDTNSTTSTGINYSSFGTRINLLNGTNYKPSMGIQFSLNLPFRSVDYKVDHLSTKVIFILRQKLWDKGSLLINSGLNFNGIIPNPAFLYTASIHQRIGDKWNVFIENYGQYFTATTRIGLNAGAAILATPNLQFDLFGGFNFSDNSLSPHVSCGVSWRTKQKTK